MKKKFKPTNIVLAAKSSSFMTESSTTSSMPNSQEVRYEISASGAFVCQDIKISKNGISEVPLTLDSQEPSLLPGQFKTKKVNPPKINFDELERVKHLGDGASSSVDLVKDHNNNLYAMKSVSISKERVKLMYAEIKSLHKCRRCPHIISMTEAYYRTGQLHILLEVMDMDLEHLLKKLKRIPEDILGLIIGQVLLALDYLHRKKGIIHRDLKPANILIKVSDFGLTGISSGLQNEEVFKTSQGTILYMSPERLSGEKHSFKADIWSVGVVCIELCMGKLPYEHHNNFFDVMQEATSMGNIELNEDLFSNDFQDFIRALL
eukprot:gene5977-9976_t